MRRLDVTLLAAPDEVPALRRTVRGHVGAEWPELQLCVSELVTNVIAHLGEGTPVTVSVSVADDGRTRVAVTDPYPLRWPVPRPAEGDDESGRGLALLDAVSMRWGVDRGPDGKTVWCEPAGPEVPWDAGRVTDVREGLLLITDG
ncbi:ATP-binding protein [Streptomyces sp. WMMC940]|uniref:ATP-binding protein n=1 Tax=Streptomyces sp. WMMC940 TaxID=3015153 RepID=UPI0022B64A95|nr:ATP-binding protein [Streptomyces sp. WMMC940]MCZ7459128.1 ATP-binding protein [Streptomyces sp. WMMC940]